MPGGETSTTAISRPIDLAHLARQTMGDRELEQEVLKLFVEQALTVRDRILKVSVKDRMVLVHSLKGSARSIGASAIANWADAMEKNPEDRNIMKRLTKCVDELRDFIAAISR